MKFLLGTLVLCAGTLFADPIGLVLSGGGAKGAYEVGVWKALTEAGLAKDVQVISGTSIGAVNGALFATLKDPVRIEAVWFGHVRELLGPFVDTIRADVQGKIDVVDDLLRLKKLYVEEEKKKWAADHGASVEDLLPAEIDSIERRAALRASTEAARLGRARGRTAIQPVDPAVFRRALGEVLPDDWSNGTPRVYATTVAKREKKARTFLLNEEPREKRLAAIAASSAFPGLFAAPVEIDGMEYVDGGCRGGDNTPLRPVLEHHPAIRTIIVVYLDAEKRLGHSRRQAGEGRNIVEVIPSQDLLGMFGCVDCSAETVKKLIDLGYRDARAALAARQMAGNAFHPCSIGWDTPFGCSSEDYRINGRRLDDEKETGGAGNRAGGICGLRAVCGSPDGPAGDLP